MSYHWMDWNMPSGAILLSAIWFRCLFPPSLCKAGSTLLNVDDSPLFFLLGNKSVSEWKATLICLRGLERMSEEHGNISTEVFPLVAQSSHREACKCQNDAKLLRSLSNHLCLCMSGADSFSYPGAVSSSCLLLPLQLARWATFSFSFIISNRCTHPSLVSRNDF